MMKNICVFCGAKNGNNPAWIEQATHLGQGIAQRGWRLVYGGAGSGLMGTTARATLQSDGKVLGIMPEGLRTEQAIESDKVELRIVKNMQERKEMMMEEADAFVIIPGGIGTLDELFEVWTAKQLNLLTKPIVIANWNAYYDHLIAFIQQSHQSGFLTDSHLQKIIFVNTVDEVFDTLGAY